MAIVSLVWAEGRNGVIGAGGTLPWRQPTDLKAFKRITLGKPVVMGRKTWASLGRALPGRDNIVVSRDQSFRPPGAWTFGALDPALACAQARARAEGAGEICVIGGGEIFLQTLPAAHRVYRTVIAADPAGDARAPILAPGDWRRVEAREAEAGPGDDHAMRFEVWERADPGLAAGAPL